MNSNNSGEYRFAIEYYIFREGENIIAYCPSLDISTSGKDYSDAVKNFYERFQIYIETSLEMGTLWDDLKDHGWKVTEKKLTPPPFSRLVRKPEVSRLLGGHINYEKVSALLLNGWRLLFGGRAIASGGIGVYDGEIIENITK